MGGKKKKLDTSPNAKEYCSLQILLRSFSLGLESSMVPHIFTR